MASLLFVTSHKGEKTLWPLFDWFRLNEVSKVSGSSEQSLWRGNALSRNPINHLLPPSFISWGQWWQLKRKSTGPRMLRIWVWIPLGKIWSSVLIRDRITMLKRLVLDLRFIIENDFFFTIQAWVEKRLSFILSCGQSYKHFGVKFRKSIFPHTQVSFKTQFKIGNWHFYSG